MSSMNFTCDVCGREVFSCTFVNGMKFCAKCYQETFGETDKDRKIADLEAKLAESEEKKESYRLQNEQHHLQLLQFYSRLGVEAFGADIHEKALETLMIMKDQLAEKEKEIEELKRIGEKGHLNDLLEEERKEKKILIKAIEQADQDKISFALEQLEKVLKILEEKQFYKKEDTAYCVHPAQIAEYIDNQIEELKKEMK